MSVSFPVFSYAKIYKWVDEKGNIHFTDNPSKIPSGAEIKEEEFFIQRPSSSPPQPDSSKEKQNGGEEKVQDQFQKEDLETKLTNIQKEIKKKKANQEALEKELKRPKYKTLVRRERLLQKDLGKVRKDIAQLKKEQTEIQKKIKALSPAGEK